MDLLSASTAITSMSSLRFPAALPKSNHAPALSERRSIFHPPQHQEPLLLPQLRPSCPNPTPGWTSASDCKKPATPSPPPPISPIPSHLLRPHHPKANLPHPHKTLILVFLVNLQTPPLDQGKDG